MKKLIFVLAVSGCAQGLTWIDESKIGTAPENSQKVINLVTADYKLKVQPNVTWYGKGFDCKDIPYAWVDNGECVYGAFFASTQEIAISNMGLVGPIHKTPIAHELCHQMLFEAHEDLDGNHTGRCFVEGGIVDKENEKLASLGF